MERKLLWSLYNDVFACRVPANHVVIFWTLQKTAKTSTRTVRPMGTIADKRKDTGEYARV
jgi:hypothetical protein